MLPRWTHFIHVFRLAWADRPIEDVLSMVFEVDGLYVWHTSNMMDRDRSEFHKCRQHSFPTANINVNYLSSIDTKFEP